MTDSTQEREARNYIKEVVADLETELEMYEQALTRANAVIERVVAACNETIDTCSINNAEDNYDAGRAHVASDLRTILEGNGA